LTETAPPVISFSAARREAIPAAAMIFCKRSEGMLRKAYQTAPKKYFFTGPFGQPSVKSA
jgi:hypothetical protein